MELHEHRHGSSETDTLLTGRHHPGPPRRARTAFAALLLLAAGAAAAAGVFAVRAASDRRALANARAVAAGEICTTAGAVSTTLPPGMYTASAMRAGAALGRRTENATRTTLLWMRGADVEQHFFSDAELPFWQESNFRYLSGYERPGAADLVCGGQREAGAGPFTLECMLFVKQPTLQDAIWNGKPVTLDELRTIYQVDHIFWKSNFTAQVTALVARLNTTQSVEELQVLPQAPGRPATVAPPTPLTALPQNSSRLIDALGEARGIKTEQEVQLMRVASRVGAEAHRRIMKAGKTSQYEFEIEAAFLGTHIACGLKQQAYLPIVGSGERASILHYNTNMQRLENNWLLVDAGGSYLGYAADITRTWPLNGHFSSLQRTAYEIVLGAQTASLAQYRTGETWVNASTAATTALLKGLLAAGLVNGTLEELQKDKIASVFMPHSLGHHLGLDVHDDVPGGLGQCHTSEDPSQGIVCPGTFKHNMVLTCEPGLYFIPELLRESYADPTKARHLVKREIERYLAAGIGGVRIEDVVRIRANGNDPELLSGAIPRTVAEIESYLQG